MAGRKPAVLINNAMLNKRTIKTSPRLRRLLRGNQHRSYLNRTGLGRYLSAERRCTKLKLMLTVHRFVAMMIVASACSFAQQNDPNRKDWIQAFNGKNLDGWVMKITGYPLGENYGNTFRVENGLLKVVLRPVSRVRRQVRPHLLPHEVLALHRGRGVPVRRRAGEGRPGLGAAQQRHHDPLPGAGDDGQGSGFPDLGGGPTPGRRSDRRALHGQHVLARH